MRTLLISFVLIYGCLNVAFAEQQIGVLMPAVEDAGTIADVDNTSGSITINGKRYQLTRETIIHYAPGENAVGYGKFKFTKDMNIGFKKEKSAIRTVEPRITEVWVLHNNQ